MDIDAPSTKRARKATEKLETSQNQAKLRFPNRSTYKPAQHAVNFKIESNAEAKLLPSVALSLFDKASQLRLSEDQLMCYGCDGGYRMVRATHGVHAGGYYWEAEMVTNGDDSEGHVRLGWSTREGELQAPVGYDRHSYGYRDIAGSFVHDSVRIDHLADGFTVGDILGCYLYINPSDSNENKIVFFKNGIEQGVAFAGTDVPSQIYFPAISIYRSASVRVNFGPTFIIKPDTQLSYIAISELQPLSVEDRKIHDARIAAIQQEREERLRRSIKQEEEREGGGEEATPAAAVVEEQTVLVEDL